MILVLRMGDTVEVKAENLGGESILEAPIRVLKKVGDFVSKEEVIFVLETDKTSLEIVSPIQGVIQELRVSDEDIITKGQSIAVIRKQDGVLDTSGASIVKPEESSSLVVPDVTPQITEYKGKKDPAVKASVKDGQSFSPVAADVSDFIAGARISPSERSSNFSSNVGKEVSRKDYTAAGSACCDGDKPKERRVKMSKIRQVIAARLKESQNIAATLSTFNEVDMSAVMTLREKYRDGFTKKHDVKLGFMSFFIKAVVLACKEIPVLNAEISGDEIIYRDFCNVGVAVGTDKGLVVPVIRGAEGMSFAELEQSLVELSVKARSGKLAASDMSGATFTITNGGVYGSLLSTPIINPPQSGILGMHSIQERPVVVEGKIEVRPMMYIALSYDHRIVDGQGAVTFLVRVKQYIEDPARMALEV